MISPYEVAALIIGITIFAYIAEKGDAYEKEKLHKAIKHEKMRSRDWIEALPETIGKLLGIIIVIFVIYSLLAWILKVIFW